MKKILLPLFYLLLITSFAAAIEVVENTDSSVTLSWENPEAERCLNEAGECVRRFIIYRDGEVIGTTLHVVEQPSERRFPPPTTFTDYYLEPSKNYHYEIGASYGFKIPGRDEDAAPDNLINIHYRKEISLGSTQATTLAYSQNDNLINPHEDIEYLGAFRMPNEDWNYAIDGFTFYPEGDPANSDDFSGSLYGIGSNAHLFAVSEIDIPTPVISKNVNELPLATTLRPFVNVGLHNPGQIPEGDIAYSPADNKLYYSWFSDYRFCSQVPICQDKFLFSSDLDLTNKQGNWFLESDINTAFNYQYGRYMFAIPEQWRLEHIPQMYMITGSYRSGALSGKGPTFVVFGQPQTGEDGEMINSQVVTEYSIWQDGYYQYEINGHHYADEWSGADWITGEKSAIVMLSNKARGQYWYGYGDGTLYHENIEILGVDPYVLAGLKSSIGGKGDIGERKEGMMVFFDPNDLAKSYRGEINPWEVQPYGSLDIDEYLIKNYDDSSWRKLGDIVYDPIGGYLYVAEIQVPISRRYGVSYEPVIHVFKLNLEDEPVDDETDDDQTEDDENDDGTDEETDPIENENNKPQIKTRDNNVKILSARMNDEYFLPGDILQIVVDTKKADQITVMIQDLGIKISTTNNIMQIELPEDSYAGDYVVKITAENEKSHNSVYRYITIG